jgi:hypothetical protein
MKTILLVVTTLFIMSCENLDVKKPANLISEDQMVEILYDVVLINSAKGVNKQVLQRSINNPHQYIYKKHNIDFEILGRFDQSDIRGCNLMVL